MNSTTGLNSFARILIAEFIESMNSAMRIPVCYDFMHMGLFIDFHTHEYVKNPKVTLTGFTKNQEMADPENPDPPSCMETEESNRRRTGAEAGLLDPSVIHADQKMEVHVSLKLYSQIAYYRLTHVLLCSS